MYAFLLLNPYNHLPTQTIIYLVYQFSFISQFFSLCMGSTKYFHYFCWLDLHNAKSIHTSFFQNKKKSDELNECFTHTHSHLIYTRILWEKALQVYMIHNEKVHTKWKPMRYYYMLMTNIARLGHSTSSRSKNKIGCQTCDQSPFL